MLSDTEECDDRYVVAWEDRNLRWLEEEFVSLEEAEFFAAALVDDGDAFAHSVTIR